MVITVILAIVVVMIKAAAVEVVDHSINQSQLQRKSASNFRSSTLSRWCQVAGGLGRTITLARICAREAVDHVVPPWCAPALHCFLSTSANCAHRWGLKLQLFLHRQMYRPPPTIVHVFHRAVRSQYFNIVRGVRCLRLWYLVL